MTDHQNYSDSATAKLAGAATAPVFIAAHASEGLPSSDAAGTGAVQRSSAESCDLIERLRNPMWAHGNAPFLSPQLEQEENLAAMNEAAAEIERLRHDLDRHMQITVDVLNDAQPAPATRQYYYRMNGCNAAHSQAPDCVCWHDEGTGPYADRSDAPVTWRTLNEPQGAGK